MNFEELLKNNLGNATLAERHIYYESLRNQVTKILHKNNIPEESEITRKYKSSLALAISNYENIVAERSSGAHQISHSPPDMKYADTAHLSRPDSEIKPQKNNWKVWAASLGASIILGMVVSRILFGISDPLVMNISTRIEIDLPQYQKNLAHLQSMHTALLQYRQLRGQFPSSENIALFSNAVKNLTEFSAMTTPEGVQHNSLYYQSDGRDFKLRYHRTGDCYLARIKNPELVDELRASGPIDCQDYGLWSENGKKI